MSSIETVFADRSPVTTTLFLILLFASITIPLRVEVASALSFYDPVELHESLGGQSYPHVAAAGSNVYVVWSDYPDGDTFEEDVFIGKSTNNGTSFGSAGNISNTAGVSWFAQVAASGSNVYVVWQDETENPGAPEIFFARSTDSGDSFGAPVNLSNSFDDSSNVPKIAISGDNVYVTWEELGDIFLSISDDNGANFGTAENISAIGSAFKAAIAAAGSNVFVAWEDNNEIYLSISDDNGANFGTAENISSNASTSNTPHVAASGSNVYVVWDDDVDGSFIFDAFFAGSADNGSSFPLTDNISDNPDFSSRSHVAASGSNVYVVWDDDTGEPGVPDIFFSASTDSDSSFSDGLNLSNADGTATDPKVAVSSNFTYVVWQDSTSGVPDVFIRVIEDKGPPTITIENVSDNSPRWDLDSVEVSGTANADNTDTITLDWGDGSTTTGIAISGSAWGPVSHTYDSGHAGENSIVARLIDQFDTERAASDPEIIDVKKHAAALTLDSIMSVVKGSNITAEGTLTDTDAFALLDGQTISFTGTGVANLASAATVTGAYSSTGASPSTAFALVTVQAHFAGDDAYEAADSDIVSYDTVEPDAATFAVAAGAPSDPIELTGFDASILFDDVPSAGSIFVSSCDSPASARYEELNGDTCIQVSPAVEMQSGTAAHLVVSYAGKTLPDGYTEEDIGIFRESVDGITEITESRDTDEQEVTGEATGFGRFIVGVAVHDATPAGAKREQVFIGDNDISFDFTEEREISLSKSSIRIGSSATITVTDFLANLNSSMEETISATISSTSDLTGITVDLEETGPDTSVFTGTFTVTKGASSTADAMLHAERGDDINASYEVNTTAPFRVVLTDVSEAGVAEMVSFDAPDSVLPVGDAYALNLVDAQLSPDSAITLTMSYANAELLDGDDPTQLRIVRVEGSECKEVVTPTLNTVEKTVTGTISTLGEYTIAFPGGSAPNTCPGVPGGGGGGLPRPGSGLVLDAVAIVLSASSGGGGTSSQSVIKSPSNSKNVDVEVDAGGETVNVRFDSATGTENLDVEAMEPSDMPGLFTKVDEIKGYGVVGGSQFTTAGTIFEIDSSNVDYEGVIQVTIPYDESLVSNEDDVRFLHFGDDGWEDATIAIDSQANTVTGNLTSLSPVVAGAVEDGTFGALYFMANPTKRMAVTDAQLTDALDNRTLEGASQVSLQVTIKNLQRANQTYAFIIQVLDEDGFTQSISWQTGELGMGESTIISRIWKEAGAYDVRMFVWTDVSKPAALSKVATKDIIVA